MAVSKNLLERNLALEYQDGLDKKGKAIMKKATYKKCKTNCRIRSTYGGSGCNKSINARGHIRG